MAYVNDMSQDTDALAESLKNGNDPLKTQGDLLTENTAKMQLYNKKLTEWKQLQDEMTRNKVILESNQTSGWEKLFAYYDAIIKPQFMSSLGMSPNYTKPEMSDFGVQNNNNNAVTVNVNVDKNGNYTSSASSNSNTPVMVNSGSTKFY